jgi:hypothetical protein
MTIIVARNPERAIDRADACPDRAANHGPDRASRSPALRSALLGASNESLGIGRRGQKYDRQQSGCQERRHFHC